MEIFMFIVGYVVAVLALERGTPGLGSGVIDLLSLGVGAALGFGFVLLRDKLGL